MKIVVVTENGNKHETELPEEMVCHSDILTALKNNINPADALAELACAGSEALRGNVIKPEKNEILQAILYCD